MANGVQVWVSSPNPEAQDEWSGPRAAWAAKLIEGTIQRREEREGKSMSRNDVHIITFEVPVYPTPGEPDREIQTYIDICCEENDIDVETLIKDFNLIAHISVLPTGGRA
jgi:hypothetical protein